MEIKFSSKAAHQRASVCMKHLAHPPGPPHGLPVLASVEWVKCKQRLFSNTSSTTATTAHTHERTHTRINSYTHTHGFQNVLGVI